MPGSSVAEQVPVKHLVVGSIPTWAANLHLWQIPQIDILKTHWESSMLIHSVLIATFAERLLLTSLLVKKMVGFLTCTLNPRQRLKYQSAWRHWKDAP